MGIEVLIIIIVIAVVLFIIIGIGAVTPNIAMNDFEPNAISNQNYRCERTYWESEPQMRDNVFQGKMVLHCTVDRVHQVNFSQMRASFADGVVATAQQVHSDPIVRVSEGVITRMQDLSVKLDVEEGAVDSKGTSVISSDDKSFLSTRYVSEDFSGRRGAHYVKQLDTVVKIQTQSHSDSYEVTVENEMKIKKPWFLIFPKRFQSTLTKYLTKAMDKKSDRIMAQVTSHF